MRFSVKQILEKSRLLLALSAIATIFYFYILYELGGIDFIKNSLFSTGDSLEYKEYADWLSGKIDYCNPYRTFFYPLIILISTKLLGFYGTWIFQFLFWISGSIFIFKTALRITGRKDLATVSFLFAVSNISLIVYTAHALTEVAAFFFLTLFMYLLSMAHKKNQKPVLCLSLTIIISVLATIRPVFQICWYFWLIAFFIINYKSIIRHPLQIFLIIIASSPVIIQKAINKTKHNTFSSTEIGDYNLRYYFYKKVNFFVTDTFNQSYNELPDSIHAGLKEKASQLSNAEIVSYLFFHPCETIEVYWDNITENLKQGNPYIDRKTNYSLSKWTENTNHNFIFYIHLIMTFLWIYYLIKNFSKSNLESHFIFLSGLMLFYILYSSGITYWAGDRLVVYVAAVWSVLYPFLIFQLALKNKQLKKVTPEK
ncbi:MAG: hypothetical protein HY063_07480 [Bacteroidetes bacterium]|nr:hypothetical protein [Bacteroidota bacterium]